MGGWEGVVETVETVEVGRREGKNRIWPQLGGKRRVTNTGLIDQTGGGGISLLSNPWHHTSKALFIWLEILSVVPGNPVSGRGCNSFSAKEREREGASEQLARCVGAERRRKGSGA